ncbi:MAG TPA: maleylpyruvate isomerase N-terminal domain-containing protein, partial [Actinomycetes bacterium]|nr:maleylpyruvate isomerase N-terminal domain-containing protein [Actinomycetes bacterium]
MSRSGAAARQLGGVELLERAIGYALGAVQGVTPALLAAPTPCRDWDLRGLLHHADDSLAALLEGLGGHAVRPAPPAGPGTAWDRRTGLAFDDGVDPARRFRGRAQRL